MKSARVERVVRREITVEQKRGTVARPPTSQVEYVAARFGSARDGKLRERVIESQVGLVEALAGKFARHGAPMEDLVQVGIVGLIQALDRFNPALGVKFSTY